MQKQFFHAKIISCVLLLCIMGIGATQVIAQLTTLPAEIHCKHFIYGYPLGAPATNDLIIRDLYALSSNDETKFADWVCYYLTPHETQGMLDLERNWRTDPWLAHYETLESTPKDDYENANNLGYERGHQAPLASFKGSRYASQVNYYSNITPQNRNLNQGPWKKLEDRVRGLVDKYGHTWVMTGPLYERHMPPLPKVDETCKVPSGYWKIIVIDESGVLRVAAFIMDQNTPRSSDLMDQLVEINEVEQRSGLNFLWELPDTQEDELESNTFESWVREWSG